MEKITLLVQASKDFGLNTFKQKLNQLGISNHVEILIISYQNKSASSDFDYPVFTVSDHEDISFSQVLQSVSTDRFLFFNPKIDYPDNFFHQILSQNKEEVLREKGNMWRESIAAVQQSNYGLCGPIQKQTESFSFLNESALYNKKDVESLNTDKMNVHIDLANELYRYASKKKLNFTVYTTKKEKVEYISSFRILMANCQHKAQEDFKIFPALFVLFFLFFGMGAAFYTAIFLIFLLGMSAYFLAITLEAFGLATIKKNGGLLIILLFLFPFIHLVYGLESIISKLKS